jgi:hypothetical protein
VPYSWKNSSLYNLDEILCKAWHSVVMPKRSSKNSKPADLNQLARAIVDEMTDESSPKEEPREEPCHPKNPNAVALGKLGGKKGGSARAKKLSPEQRKAIAEKAARARWHQPS